MNITWNETTEERYDEMLCILPPAVMTGIGYLVGEPMDHDRCPITGYFGPRFSAFAKVNGKYYEAVEVISISGFKRLIPQDIRG